MINKLHKQYKTEATGSLIGALTLYGPKKGLDKVIKTYGGLAVKKHGQWEAYIASEKGEPNIVMDIWMMIDAGVTHIGDFVMKNGCVGKIKLRRSKKYNRMQYAGYGFNKLIGIWCNEIAFFKGKECKPKAKQETKQEYQTAEESDLVNLAKVRNRKGKIYVSKGKELYVEIDRAFENYLDIKYKYPSITFEPYLPNGGYGLILGFSNDDDDDCHYDLDFLKKHGCEKIGGFSIKGTNGVQGFIKIPSGTISLLERRGDRYDYIIK